MPRPEHFGHAGHSRLRRDDISPAPDEGPIDFPRAFETVVRVYYEMRSIGPYCEIESAGAG